jgi:hypothetical protein
MLYTSLYNRVLVGIRVSVLLVQFIYIILINILCNSRCIGYFINSGNKYKYCMVGTHILVSVCRKWWSYKTGEYFMYLTNTINLYVPSA